MTDRERQMISAYIPSPSDPELGFMDYYMMDSADRVIRVHVVSLSYTKDVTIYEVIRKRGMEYAGVFNAIGECESMPGWYYMRALYDNKEDCRNNTHMMYDGWERLRELEKEETS